MMEKQSSQLFIVSTPIGNIKDITYRAIEVFNAIDVIFAEDKRITQKLLNYYNIKKLLRTYNKDNEKMAIEDIIEFIKLNKIIALVTDAGTPCISDPGSLLIKTLLDKHINFEIIPGPTAFVLALIYSGFNTETFFFQGFTHHKQHERIKILKELQLIKGTIVLYESCHRIKETLYDILEYFAPPIFICRELTKLFEERLFVNNEEEVEHILEKGEFTIVIDNNNIQHKTMEVEQITSSIHTLKKEGFTKKDVVKILKAFGYKRNYIYDLIQSMDVYSNKDTD